MDDTLIKMIGEVFGSKIWHSTSLLERIGNGDSLGTMIQIGYAFAALMLIFQLVIMVLNISKSPQIWENLGPLIYRTIIISALISAPLYNLIFRYTISETTNLMANVIFSDYSKDFLISWKNVFAGSGDLPTTPWQIITASFSTSLVSNIISSSSNSEVRYKTRRLRYNETYTSKDSNEIDDKKHVQPVSCNMSC